MGENPVAEKKFRGSLVTAVIATLYAKMAASRTRDFNRVCETSDR